MKWSVVLGLLLGAGLPARADPYWISYEGEDFPETHDWLRIHGPIPAERSIEDGALVIDSRADVGIYDYYEMTFGGPVDPAAGEVFLMGWRLQVDRVDGFDDPGIHVTSDPTESGTYYAIGFTFSEDRVMSAYEPGVAAGFRPGVFHAYELRSSDMRAYQLYIDDALAIEGAFTDVSGPTRIDWGDAVDGARSLARWDYVGFGVVPEPAAWMCAAAVVALRCRQAIRRARRRDPSNGFGTYREYSIMRRGIPVLFVAAMAHSVIAANHIREWSGHYQVGVDYSIDQVNRTVRIHKNSAPAYFWKFEAYDDVTQDPGDIDDIRIEPTGTVGEIHLRVLGDGHQYGARNVKKIDLLTNADNTTEIYSVYVSGDLGENDPLEANRVGSILANGSLLHTLYASDDITGDVTFHGDLQGWIVAHAAQNITVTGTGAQTGNISIGGSYAGSLSIAAAPMEGVVTVHGALSGSVAFWKGLSAAGSLVVDDDVTGSIDVGGADEGVLNGVIDIAGNVVDGANHIYIHDIQDPGHFECQNMGLRKSGSGGDWFIIGPGNNDEMQNYLFGGSITVYGTLSGRIFFKGHVETTVIDIGTLNATDDPGYARGGLETGIAYGPDCPITVANFPQGRIGYARYLDPNWHSGPFQGHVTVTGDMGSTAEISTTQYASGADLAIDLGAHIVVQGEMGGTIASTGNIGLADSDAEIEIGGHLSGTIATVNADDAHRGDILHDIVIGGSVIETGEVESIGDLAANIQIGGDLAGTIATVAGSDPPGGDILHNIAIGGSLTATGEIHAIGGLAGEIQICGALQDHPGVPYEVQIEGAMGGDAAIVVNWDAQPFKSEEEGGGFVDFWESGALVKVGDAEPYGGNDIDHHIFLITCQKGDLNNSGATNNFDITPFMHALQGPAVYDQAHCGLVGSMVYHADMNCDGLVNNFDITPFVLRINDPGQYYALYENCEKCAAGDGLLGGDGLRGGEGSSDPAAVAAELEEYLDPELMPLLISVGEDIVANSPDDAEAAFWAEVLAELE